MANPLDSHWSIVKRFLRYWNDTSTHGLDQTNSELLQLESLLFELTIENLPPTC